LGPAFFGLTPENKNIYLEPIFSLMYYMGFSYTEAYYLPVWQRQWFLNRTIEEIKNSNGQSRSTDSNDASTRHMMGRHRSQVPAKLRRFT